MGIVLDELHGVFDPLFDVEVFECNPSKTRASINDGARKVMIVSDGWYYV